MAVFEKTLFLAVMVVCLTVTLTAPVLSEDLDFLGEKACRLVNKTSNQVITTKTCGCGNETRKDCTLGKLPLTGEGVNITLEATFCDVIPESANKPHFKGVLGAACLITSKDKSVTYNSSVCPGAVKCVEESDKAISFTFKDGKEAVAYFCPQQLKDQEDEKSTANEEAKDIADKADSSDSSKSSDSKDSDSKDSDKGDEKSQSVTDKPDTDDKCISLRDGVND